MEFLTAHASGKKRPAADDFPTPLSKRLELLSLKPVPGTRRIVIPEERMDVDSTAPNVVYIHDIDAELASDDEDPDTKGKIVFVPDIEREMTRIPHAVLKAGREDVRNGCTDVVLYSIPKALTVDEDMGGVRKVILESRARIRQKQKEGRERGEEEQLLKEMSGPGVKTQMVADMDMDGDIDMDAMDIE